MATAPCRRSRRPKRTDGTGRVRREGRRLHIAGDVLAELQVPRDGALAVRAHLTRSRTKTRGDAEWSGVTETGETRGDPETVWSWWITRVSCHMSGSHIMLDFNAYDLSDRGCSFGRS